MCCHRLFCALTYVDDRQNWTRRKADALPSAFWALTHSDNRKKSIGKIEQKLFFIHKGGFFTPKADCLQKGRLLAKGSLLPNVVLLALF
jgi:hypothetical protein